MAATLESVMTLARELSRDQQVELAETLLDLPHLEEDYHEVMKTIRRRIEAHESGRSEMVAWPRVQADAKAILESY